MQLIFRLLRVAIGTRFRPRLQPLDESVLTFRVLPNDLDANLHLNNGRYLSLMDLGRLDLVVRLGAGREIVRRRWRPAVGSVMVRFRRELAPFRRYELRTRLLCWDERWIFLEQRFTRGAELLALAIVKGVFVGPQGRVRPAELAELIGFRHPPPPVPPAIRAWEEAEAALHAAAASPASPHAPSP